MRVVSSCVSAISKSPMILMVGTASSFSVVSFRLLLNCVFMVVIVSTQFGGNLELVMLSDEAVLTIKIIGLLDMADT